MLLELSFRLIAFAALSRSAAYAQTFQRLGTCPTLGCVFPPDQADFFPGQVFDVRVEIHAPLNGSEAFNHGVPDEKFSLTIQRVGDRAGPKLARDFWKRPEPALEKWTFNYFEDLFAQDAKTPTVVNVASKAYRQIALYTPGEYVATLHYYNTQKTVAHWTVRAPTTPPNKHKAKNVLFFIGDGMTISMQTAARLIAHKSVNGKYQSLLQLDQMDNLGHQMTHSIDSFITDSANSATALNTGHKSSVNALNVYADSSPDPQDDPKVETLAEMFRRVKNGLIGIVTTAFVADATPAAVVAHTRDRDQAGPIVDTFLRGEQNYSWPGVRGVDVLFGGGAENFLPGPSSFGGQDYYAAFKNAGYSVVHDNAGLQKLDVRKRALGIFSVSNMAKWVDRKVKTQNLKGQQNSPTGDKTDALDQPGLKEMTLKAIDILHARSKADKKQGWYLMSEAASIDKMMHVLDYHRALGELLELDDTVRAAIAHLKKLGIYDETLIVVTADHGHGFDVFGGVDTQYLRTATSDRQKRTAVGNYINSGLSGYTVSPGASPTNNSVVIGAQGANFPVQWDPRYSLAAGVVAFPDHRENYTTAPNGPRLPAVKGQNGEGYVANPDDATDGFSLSGTLPTNAAQGVHSLTDVAVYANGPGSEAFRGVYNNIDIFFKMANALGLATFKNTTTSSHGH